MASIPQPVDKLEAKAERQREQLNRDVAELRYDIERQFDLRRIAGKRIHARPRTVYGAAAAAALLFGYLFARLLKA